LYWLDLEGGKIGVCGLNPHAGDGGALGGEEQQVINPVIRRLQQAGVSVEGAIPADTIFHQAKKGAYEMVVAMYHDQGLAPLKMIGFEEGVNVTLGLPIVRTSPDHGTAFSLAGRGEASASSMRAAIRMALRLAGRENPWR
jgi:4-hydroxythreonine-4-phosphate dehydrogenase